MDTRVLTAHVPVALAERVDALAGKMDRSRGWIVKQALAAWVEKEEERQRLMQRGTNDAEAGRLTAQEKLENLVEVLRATSSK